MVKGLDLLQQHKERMVAREGKSTKLEPLKIGQQSEEGCLLKILVQPIGFFHQDQDSVNGTTITFNEGPRPKHFCLSSRTDAGRHLSFEHLQPPDIHCGSLR